MFTMPITSVRRPSSSVRVRSCQGIVSRLIASIPSSLDPGNDIYISMVRLGTKPRSRLLIASPKPLPL
jgi:hypothetical protein